MYLKVDFEIFLAEEPQFKQEVFQADDFIFRSDDLGYLLIGNIFQLSQNLQKRAGRFKPGPDPSPVLDLFGVRNPSRTSRAVILPAIYEISSIADT